MKRMMILITLMAMVFLLAACGAESDSGEVVNNDGAVGDNAIVETNSSNSETRDTASADKVADTAVTSENTNTSVQAEPAATLNEDYEAALSIQAQLALGTVRLEETELAVDEAQANELLPFWQALQSLSQSDTTAPAELQAVVKQIENTMSADQITAIADMQLTEASLSELLESGELAVGRGFGGGGNGGSTGAGQGGPGGFGGGGFPGGGPGEGGIPGGGPGGFGGGNVSEDDLATRQAQFAENGFALVQDRMLTGMVTRLLEEKTGVVSEGAPRADVMNEAFTAVAEAAGLTAEDVQNQAAAGQTLAQIVSDNGGDLAALQAALVEIFGDLPNAADLDLEQSTADWLGLDQ